MNFAADPEQKDKEFIAINPVIVDASKQIVDDGEGCLSFPQLYAKVRRSKKVKVQAYNLKLHETPFRNSHQLTASDVPAIPFKADQETIRRLKCSATSSDYGWR